MSPQQRDTNAASDLATDEARQLGSQPVQEVARHPGTSMANESTKTVLVSLGAALGIALTKVGAAAVTGSSALAAEASHSLADTANDLLLFVAQRRSSHRPDDQHALGYGRKAFFWALLAALGVLVAGVAFSLRTGGTDPPGRYLVIRRRLRGAGDLYGV